MTDEIAPVRDADGKIDIQGTMQVDHRHRGRLGARASGAMALAAPQVAVKYRHQSRGEARHKSMDGGRSLP